jgi:hypothetical protein
MNREPARIREVEEIQAKMFFRALVGIWGTDVAEDLISHASQAVEDGLEGVVSGAEGDEQFGVSVTREIVTIRFLGGDSYSIPVSEAHHIIDEIRTAPPEPQAG